MTCSKITSGRAVVSGSSGFIGRRLAYRLVSSDVSVLGLDLTPAPFAMRGYQHVQSSLDQAADLIVNHLHGGGVYFHMAGLADMAQCEKNPVKAYDLNVALTFTALEICQRADDVMFVFPSTGGVYGFHRERPVVEDDLVQPQNIYTGSKLAAEVLVQSFVPKRVNGAILARLSNVYGPFGSENTVLGRLLGQVSRRQSLKVLDESPVRDFIFVDDAVEALVRLGGLRNIGGALVVNVSTGRGIKIGDVVDVVSTLSGLTHDCSESRFGKPTNYLVLRNARLQKTTGWSPQIQLERGLEICFEAM